ncbi:hypothetical protein GCM10011611_67460 [Aliidongia dinghuensis]|uniref:Uncharacterized protein n=1 Tax=Aliidongia dinghuensis TaxID=1867774 RepID=A0A8J3E761_9PROT|nr:hypothetical protein [Aliidongia dinghuensis]GGF51485.1 hypothetical protein GCM10011611_67460 [Aliidongia dinghuensis]
MRKLLRALGTWQGPEKVAEAITARGFLVPRFYRDEMIAYCRACGVDDSSDLETYWNEASREVVSCGGQANPRQRRFIGEIPYRSAYLDQLAEAKKSLPPSDFLEIQPCLLRWLEEDQSQGAKLGKALLERAESFKDQERARHPTLPSGWTGKKRDVPPIFRHFAEQCGFIEKKLPQRGFIGGGKAFCKETASGLVFHCWVDTGGLPDVAPRVPLEFFVSHVEDRFPPLGAGPDTICVGAECYARFRSPENAIYGIYALINIFDAFYSTFE